MEQHPIPQDVTGFQFKLIGTMTVKQFGYVAAGGILAVISWYAPAPGLWFLLTKFILVPVFGLTGVIIAFVPIEGRPVDVMATNFIHALMSPNQYIYIKKGRKFSFTEIATAKISPVSTKTPKTENELKAKIENKKSEQLQALLSNRYKNVKNNLDKKEIAFFKTIETVSQTNAPTPRILPPKPIIQTPVSTPLPPQIPKPNQPPANQEEAQLHQKRISELEGQIQDIHSQKEQVEQELLRLRNELSIQKPGITPAILKEQLALPTIRHDITHVRNIPESMTKNAGLSSVSDTPNVIVGIVKDSRGNILPNILVEVKDKSGNPVRAFKTNPLGQFASATPLVNGIYTIELEDPKKQHAFDIIQINASGEIMLPIEIISHDAREELRKALFN